MGKYFAVLLIAVLLFAWGAAAGTWAVRSQHSRGECEHTEDRQRVEAVLDCVRTILDEGRQP